MENIVFTREADSVLREKLQHTAPEDVYVLVDNNTRNYCLETLTHFHFLKEHIITIPEGEHNKSLESAARIWNVLSEQGARRNSVLVNIGGGLITDIGGFAAACFKRGIRCINIPTTLLAQVDASVGGKTGVNFRGLKNEIGIFSIPECVIIDNRFLASLPERQILSGFAEMIKHALLTSEEAVDEILQADLTRMESAEFLALIEKSVAFKAGIVEADPTEKGIRKALNFGHTVGHAIESSAIERGWEWYHGDAVAYGMIVELYLSVRQSGLDSRYYEKIRKFIRGHYPVYKPVAEKEDLYNLMLHDKKNEQAGVNFTLLCSPGEFEINHYCEKTEIIEALSVL